MRKELRERINQSISIVVSYFLISSPVYAADLEVDGTTNATLDTSRNGVPVVNIANPNSKGLSHNKFKNYNVNKNGLILNNSKNTSVNTKLSGYIYGNKNLSSNAKVILNEVTSNNRSRLHGYTEIAGKKADLIIANPNGININGAGFINTRNITLTTGKPNIVFGNIASFSVKGGDISIDGDGLDTKSQDSTYIYTSYLKLNAAIHANNLDVKLGNNEIDYNTKEITSSSNTNQDLLLDSSALGGMYANKIALVGTSKGVGVNLPPEVLASSSDITITNDGKISLQKLSAKTDVNVESKSDSIESSGNIHGVNTNLTASKDITNSAIISAKDNVNLDSTTLNNTKTILSGVNSDESLNTNGSVNINNITTTNSGTISSTDTNTINTTDLSNNTDGLINSAKTLTLNSTNSITNKGTINSNDSSSIETSSLTNTKDITATNSLDLQTDSITHSDGTIASRILTINNTKDISTTDGTIIGNNLTFNTDTLSTTDTQITTVDTLVLNATTSLTNSGEILANDITLKTNTLSNTKDISAINDLSIDATTSTTNDGEINSNNTLTLNTKTLANNNTILAKDATLNTTNITNTKDILSSNDLTINNTNTIDNTSSNIKANNKLTLFTSILNNSSGNIKSEKDLTITSSHINNQNGNIEALNDSSITTNTINLNNSNIFANNDQYLKLDALDNISTSTIGAKNNLTIDASSYITNRTSLLSNGITKLTTNGALTNYSTIAGDSLDISASSLTNDSTISGGSSSSSINISGDITNNSRVSGVGNLSVKGNSITNNGYFNSGNNLTITSSNLTNNRTLFSTNDMYLYTSGTLNNNANSYIFAMNNMTLAANSSNGRTGTINNNVANIETYNGDINLYANTFNNKSTKTIDQLVTYEPKTYKVFFEDISIRSNVIDGDLRVYNENGEGYQAYLDKYNLHLAMDHNGNHTSGSVSLSITDPILSTNSYSKASLYSGRNLNFHVGTVNNNLSNITSSGNMYFDVGTVNNENKQYSAQTTWTIDKCDGFVKQSEYSTCGNTSSWMEKNKDGVRIDMQADVVVYNSSYTIDGVLSVSSLIQAGGSISGNIDKVNNGTVRSNAGVGGVSSRNESTSNTTQSSTSSSTAITNNTINTKESLLNLLKTNPDKIKEYIPYVSITIPTDDYGLFVRSKYPNSRYLIETNPEFTMYENFLSSDYMMDHIEFPPSITTKRVGDDFYENKLIRDSIQAQTGKTFLNKDLSNDYDQYKYLMDNALSVQDDLKLSAGISLSAEQINSLTRDIVWMEEKIVAGEKVLVPVVYIANIDDVKIEGAAIIAGGDIDLKVNTLSNKSSLVEAGGDISIKAQNNIENISGTIKAENIDLESTNGSIINKRYTEEKDYSTNSGIAKRTELSDEGLIVANNTLNISAKDKFKNLGSTLKAKDITLEANSIEISTVEDKKEYVSVNKMISTTNLLSNLEADNINMNSKENTLIKGANITAKNDLSIEAKKLDILNAQDTYYSQVTTTSKGTFSSSSTTTTKATSTNIASNLSGANINLTTTKDNINIVGSNINATKDLSLDSANDINILAGYDGTLNESQTKKSKFSLSGLITGGDIYTMTEDMEGKMTKTAVSSNLSGANISFKSKNDITMVGTNLDATDTISAEAQDIIIKNATNEEKTYSKHTEVKVSMADVAKVLTRPDELVSTEDGKASMTLAEASYDSSEKTKTKTTVTSSNLNANNILLTSTSDDYSKGNILIEGSNLNANDTIALDASGDVTIKEAKETEQTTSKDVNGKGELKATAKNEYDQTARALKAVKKAKEDLSKAKNDYKQYKKDLALQNEKLAELKTKLKNKEGFIEQADVDELSSYIDDMKKDEAFYKTNILLATSTVAAKTTAAIAQAAKAARSSGTFGFNAGLELNIDAVEKMVSSYKTKSVGSNLNGANIKITANNTATIQGSNLNGSYVEIDATNTNILASQDIDTTNTSTEHKNINISMDVYGGDAMGGSVSADSSKSYSSSTTNTNSNVNANNIKINTKETTTIAGANIKANDTLDLNTKNLKVSSVQDTTKTKSQSQGGSVGFGASGVSSVGANTSNSSSLSRQTVLTSLTGNNVNINVEEDTTLKGAMIASLDKDGNDNGNLNLKTNTLNVSSLNNTTQSRSTSANANVGTSNVSVGYENQRENSKTKTLATLGEGNVQVANTEDSDTRMLNRDVDNNEVDIYDIKSGAKLDGELDTRLVTESGRQQILDDMKVTKVGFYDVAKDIMTKESLDFLDSFKHQGNKVAMYDGVQNAIKNSKDLQDKLSDPELTKEQRNEVLREVAKSVAKELNINLSDVSTVASNSTTKDGKKIKGAYHEPSGDIAINDIENQSTGDTMNSLGNELSHLLDTQRGESREGTTSSGQTYKDEYSNLMGDSMEDYANFAMYNYTDNKTLADTNSHNGIEVPKSVFDPNYDKATQNFESRNANGELEYRQLAVEEKALQHTQNASMLKESLAKESPNLSLENVNYMYQLTQEAMVDSTKQKVLDKFIEKADIKGMKSEVLNAISEIQQQIKDDAKGNVYVDLQNGKPKQYNMMDTNNYNDPRYYPSSSAEQNTNIFISAGLTTAGLTYNKVASGLAWFIDTGRNIYNESHDDALDAAINTYIPATGGFPMMPAPIKNAAAGLSYYNLTQNINEFNMKAATEEFKRDVNNDPELTSIMKNSSKEPNIDKILINKSQLSINKSNISGQSSFDSNKLLKVEGAKNDK